MTVAAPGKSASDAASAKRLAEVGRLATTDLPRAILLAKRVRKDGVVNAQVHHLVAIGLKESGAFEEAIAELGMGLAIEPNNPRLIVSVGFCLLELGRRQEAAKVFETALRLDPNAPDANYGYGWAAERLGALESAQSAFERAAALDPGHADALAGLSGLAVRRRDWSTARTHAENALSLNPLQTDAMMNLARVEIGVANLEAAEQRLRALIALPQLKPLARANAKIMLGDVLDGGARYAEAFDAYDSGKSAISALYADQFAPSGRGVAIVGVGKILQEFRATPADAWSKPAAPGPRHGERGHAFLLGFPRSGTTLLEQVLASHPDVVTLEERPVLIDAETEFLTQTGGITRLGGIVGDMLEPFRVAYWRRVREFGVEQRGKLFIDKHPLNTIRLPLIGKIFPGAKIIFAVRDPRDVVLSCFRRSFNMNASMYEFNSIESAARYYAAVMEAGDAYLDRLPLLTHQIRYEDLVADFSATASALCHFLGVEWSERMRDFAQTASERRIATPSSAQVGRGLYEEGVNQWRNYAFALGPVMPILAPWIEKFGYAAEQGD